MDRRISLRCCECFAGTCVAWTCHSSHCEASLFKGSRCRIRPFPGRACKRRSLPGRLTLPGRWRRAPMGTTGRWAAGAEEHACGVTTGKRWTWPGRRIPLRYRQSPSVQMSRRSPPGAGMAPSNCGTWRTGPCSGWGSIPAASIVSPLLLMAGHSPVAEMTRSFDSGMSPRASPSRRSQARTARSMHWPGVRMGACWQVAASMEAFTCGRCRVDRRFSQALRVFSRDTAARCGH